ncbi:SRPBCC family protein [Fibrobacterota bacterium]
MSVISQSTSIDCSPKEIFQFITKPANIISVSPTMPSLHFHSPKLMLGKGQIINFDLSYGLFKLSWTSKISRFEPYTFFEDSLVEGPFKKWIHRHRFEAHGRKTIIQDEIEYEVGLGPLGKIMDTLVIGYQIENFFKKRQKKTTEKFQHIKRHIA